MMAKRYADSDSSSDEDDGNFKRRRRNSSDDNDSHSFESSFESSHKTKTLRVVDSRKDLNLSAKQKLLNEKLSSLPKYDDLFDTNPVVRPSSSALDKSLDDIKPITSGARIKAPNLEESDLMSSKASNVELISDFNKHLDDEDSKANINTPIDPRLRRLEKFNKTSETAIEGPKFSSAPLNERIHKLLIARKPMEAYNELKLLVPTHDMYKYKDQMLAMAKDWFPALIDNAYDPRAVFIEIQNINSFQNLLKDLFNMKTKLSDFWESVILSISKFVDESKIRELPQLLTKMRWILVRDIREYLQTEEIRVNIKVTNILIDHRIRLNTERDKHRRNFEAYNTPLVPPIAKASAPPAQVAPVPIIISTPSVSASAVPVVQQNSVSSTGSGQHRLFEQLIEFLKADQYLRLTQMFNRHISADNYSIIDDFGRALRYFSQTHPNQNVFELYQKLHDTLKLNSTNFSPQRLKIIFQLLLKEFSVCTQYKPNDWLCIRAHSIENLKSIENVFNESLGLIKHNIKPQIDYCNANNTLRIKFDDIEKNIPLIAPMNVILKDPRIEFRSDQLAESKEVIIFDDEAIGMFSPYRSDTSSPSSSPSKSLSPTKNDSNSDQSCDERTNFESDTQSPDSCAFDSNLESIEPKITQIAESAVQRTENVKPVQKSGKISLVIKPKPKSKKLVKTVTKKLSPLKNKLNTNKHLISRLGRTANSSTNGKISLKQVIISPQNGSNNVNVRDPRINSGKSPKSVQIAKESQISSINVSKSDEQSPTKHPRIVSNNVSSIPKSELKQIVRRVYISSSDEDSSVED